MKFGYIPKDRPDKSKLWNKVYRLIHMLLGFPSYLRRLQAPILFKFLEINREDIILDLGCGKVQYAYEIARKGFCTVAIDINLPIEELPWEQNESPSLFLIQGDGRFLPIKGDSVDKILMSSFLQMLKEDKLILKECHRILKRNGLLVLSVPEDYLYIRQLYHSNWICKKIRNLLNMPEEYEMFLSDLNRLFGVKGKGYYSLSELTDLIIKEGFTIEKYDYCPKKIGSFLFEFMLSIHYALSKRKLLPPYTFLFYPLASVFDDFLPKNSKGCEILLKAKKM